MTMIVMWTGNVPFLLYVTSGGIALIPFVASKLVLKTRKFWGVALGLAVAAVTLNVAIALGDQSNPANNVLNRDIGAIAVLALACPIVSASFAVGSVRRSALTRSAIAAAVVAGFLFVTPFFVLIAHCTSGDCL
jgi:hypothetical protein